VSSPIHGQGCRACGNSADCHVVIAAYNEARGIRAKLDNISSLQYSEGLVDVIVTSDASSDVRRDRKTYDPNRVRLIRVEGRRGKTACQNVAMQSATGEIVVFTDATTRIEPHALTGTHGEFRRSVGGMRRRISGVRGSGSEPDGRRGCGVLEL